MTRIVHCKKETYDVMIDRTTKWGNPYYYKTHVLTKEEAEYLGNIHREGGNITRSESITLFERYLRSNTDLLKSIESLRGLTLACWCHPNPCHGDIILKVLNETKDTSDIFDW